MAKVHVETFYFPSPVTRHTCQVPLRAVAQHPTGVSVRSIEGLADSKRTVEAQLLVYITEASAHRAEPIYLCRVARTYCTWRPRRMRHAHTALGFGVRPQYKTEVLAQIINGISFESALYVGLKPHDNEGGILPIVADLATTDESVWCRCIGETKAGSELVVTRPEFDRLLRDAAQRKFDMVMAWSVDRLGRSLQDLVSFLSELHALHIDLFLHQQGLDTTTPAGKAMFQMMGVFAEFERAMIAERVRAGLRRAKDEGKQLGRPRIAPELEKRILAALNQRERTGEGVRALPSALALIRARCSGSAALPSPRRREAGSAQVRGQWLAYLQGLLTLPSGLPRGTAQPRAALGEDIDRAEEAFASKDGWTHNPATQVWETAREVKRQRLIGAAALQSSIGILGKSEDSLTRLIGTARLH